jgi:hypothetical protein
VILNSDTVVRSLQLFWAIVFGVFSLLALGLAARSILLAARAAQDKPITVYADAAERLALYNRLFKGVMDDLGQSRTFAAWAIVALILSLLTRWSAPTNPPAAPAEGAASPTATHPVVRSILALSLTVLPTAGLSDRPSRANPSRLGRSVSP